MRASLLRVFLRPFLEMLDVFGWLHCSWCCYRPQTKLRKGHVFSPFCHPVHGEGCLNHCMLGYTAPGKPPRQTSPRADTLPGRHPPGRHSPQQTATAADGMHPTAMHSCYDLTSVGLVNLIISKPYNVCQTVGTSILWQSDRLTPKELKNICYTYDPNDMVFLTLRYCVWSAE